MCDLEMFSSTQIKDNKDRGYGFSSGKVATRYGS